MLTDTAIRKTAPTDRPQKLWDGAGLYLLVQPSGAKWWRLKFTFGGKQKGLSLGVYPAVTLKEARELRDEARRLLDRGVDPSVHRKTTAAVAVHQAANTFEAVAREWIAKQSSVWTTGHVKRITLRLANNVFPSLGARPIASITAPELLAALRRVESRDAVYSAHRIKAICGCVFRYAIATGRAERDPSADLRGALAPVKGGHLAAPTGDPDKVGDLLLLTEGYKDTGSPIVCAALRMSPLLFVRPGELRHMRWADLDFAAAEWRFTASKTGIQMIVPLVPQAVAILEELKPLTGCGPYVFPSARSSTRAMSDAAVTAAYRRMGITGDEMTAHGWRAIARTMLDERLHFRADIIEAQLGHTVIDPLGRSYNRTSHLPERREMMTAWATYLDSLLAAAVARRGSRF